MSHTNEIWKDIPGYEGYYMINKNGEVFSLVNNIILKCHDARGYRRVVLKSKHYQLHRLVLMAFKPHKNQDNLQVNHINGIKSDNRLENLEWCTPSENQKHAHKIGLKNQNGSKNNASKLTNKQVDEIRSKYKYRKYGCRKLAKEYNVSDETIRRVVNYVTYK